MKKIALIVMLLAGTFTYSVAQKTDSTSRTKKTISKVDKSTGVNKDGSLDMRVKANKETKARKDSQNMRPSTIPAQPTPVQKRNEQNQAKSKIVNTPEDKISGKDAKGRTIYEGPKGGRYIINSNGNKEYIKKS